MNYIIKEIKKFDEYYSDSSNSFTSSEDENDLNYIKLNSIDVII